MTECITLSKFGLCVAGMVIGFVSLRLALIADERGYDIILIPLAIGMGFGLIALCVFVTEYLLPLLPCIQVV